MCGYLAEHFGEPETYISALALKYDHQKQFKPACVVIDDNICAEIVNFFGRILQYPKDMGIVHSACAGIHYISITELGYSQTLAGLDLSKWQKRVTPFTEYMINTMIDLMGHKWMIENVYKSCLLTTYYLLKLAIRANDKASVIKILKFSNNYKGKLNEFHVELFKELLLWVTSVSVGFSSDYEDMVLRCISMLYSHNSEHCKQIAYVFTVSWINKLSCKGHSCFNILDPDDCIALNAVDELCVTSDLVHKIINRFNIFNLFLTHGPKNYFDTTKMPQAPIYHNIPVDNILTLAINAIKIARLNIKRQIEPAMSNDERITDDNVFVIKAKMNLMPIMSLSNDLCVKLYTSSIELITTFVKSHGYHHLNVPGIIYKSFIQEVFCCTSILDCQEALLFFGESLSHFLSFLLNTQLLWIPIETIEKIFEMFVANQLEFLVKTVCKDIDIIFTIGKYSLEIAHIVAKFASKNAIFNIMTNMRSAIIRAQEAIIRIYLTAIKVDGDGWQREFIHANMYTILSFLSFSMSGYLEIPKYVGNNIVGLFKLHQPPIHSSDFENFIRAQEAQSNITTEECKSIIKNYQEVWSKVIELYLSTQISPINEIEFEGDKSVFESPIKKEKLQHFQLEENNKGSSKRDQNDIGDVHCVKEDVMQKNMDCIKQQIVDTCTQSDQKLLVDRMKRRLGEIKKIILK